MRESKTGLPAEFCVGSPFSAAACAAAAVAAGDPLPVAVHQIPTEITLMWFLCLVVCLQVLVISPPLLITSVWYVLDNENIMIELQALHLLHFYFWEIAALEVPAFHWRFRSTVARGWRRVLLIIKKASVKGASAQFYWFITVKLVNLTQNFLSALWGSQMYSLVV